jgi:hypothetical protein
MAQFTRVQTIIAMQENGMVPVFYNSNPDIC